MTRALIFKSSWGWMGVAESREGLAAVVLPQRSRVAVATVLGKGGSGFDGTSSSSLLREARKQLTEYLTGAGRPSIFPLTSRQEPPFSSAYGRS